MLTHTWWRKSVHIAFIIPKYLNPCNFPNSCALWSSLEVLLVCANLPILSVSSLLRQNLPNSSFLEKFLLHTSSTFVFALLYILTST